MKFTELSPEDQAQTVKTDFLQLVIGFLESPDTIKNLISEEDFKSLMDFKPELLAPKEECNCGGCINTTKYFNPSNPRPPAQLQPLIELANKRCQERKY